MREGTLLPSLTSTTKHLLQIMSDAPQNPNSIQVAYPYKRWCFTINNPISEPALHSSLSYLVYGRETAPTTGTPHLQGYLESKQNVRITGLHKLPGFESAHFLRARGTPEQNRDYCTKGGDFVEFGTISGGKGSRTDLTHIRDIISEQPNRSGLKRIADEHPGDFIRYHRGIERMVELYKKPPPANNSIEYRPWQEDLLNIIEEGEVDPRKIHFYIDPQGAAGKSFMARQLYALYPDKTLVLSNAKHDRLYYSYEGQTIIIFDMTRSPDDEHDHYPYQVMENMKNGYRPPGMYGKPPEFFSIPHVIVFCNSTPNMNALSQDRYQLHYLSGAY